MEQVFQYAIEIADALDNAQEKHGFDEAGFEFLRRHGAAWITEAVYVPTDPLC